MARVPAPGVSTGAPAPTQESDELVADIARHLADAGEYRLTLLPDAPQELVDVRWAALRAGRVIGRRVHVTVSGLSLDSAKTPLTVRMTCPAGTIRPAIPHQRAQG